MGVLGSTFAGAFLALSGGDKKAQQGPPVNAASKDEEKFIQYVILLFLHDGFGVRLRISASSFNQLNQS
jgi:F-type H+-transporting ATPase subunit k